MPNLLVIDTSMNACTVALQRHDGQIFAQHEAMERGQAERLMPMIVDTVNQAGLTLPDINTYACVNGPGTFTGLRVGLATVRALAQVSGKPALSISTFDALAASMQEQAPLCLIIETKRTDFYVRGPHLLEGICLSANELKCFVEQGSVLVGDAVDRAVSETGLANKTISITSATPEALIACVTQGKTGNALDPVYLRGADVSTSRQKNAHIV